jgi:hypothetical protein
MIDVKLNEKQWLTRFIALMLTAFLGLFIVDKLVSWKTKLLDEEMSDSLFELVKNISFAGTICDNILSAFPCSFSRFIA